MSTSLNPEAIWSERFAEIGNVIESDCELLISRWTDRAKEEQPGAVHAHFQEMRDSLPALLRAIGRALAQCGDDVSARHCLIAMKHGEQRWQYGWKLAEVVRDYQILRLVLLDHLDRTLNHWPLTVRETMAVGLALDEAITASVVVYVAHQDREQREASERLNEFLAILGHELRNPLSAIVTTLQLLRLQNSVAPSQEQAYNVLDRQVAQLTRLLDDMLDVSRLTRGKLQLSKATVTAQEVIQRSLDTTSALLAARGHQLEVRLPEQPLELFADAGRLEQVFTNLFTNAAKYTPPDGKIAVELTSEMGQAVIRVRDNGEGISAEMLPLVFEMFAQMPKHRGQGLGIGLGLARSLIEMHDGKIEAQSDGAGKGSQFICRLPLSEASSRVAVAPQVPVDRVDGPLGRYSILIIDDQVDGLNELSLLLRLYGHEVHVAHHGPEGLEQASRIRPQVVLLDISMPGMDGYETARRLRAQPEMEQALIVAMTGFPEDHIRERALQAGFDHHLPKPVTFATVQQLFTERQRAPARPWN